MEEKKFNGKSTVRIGVAYNREDRREQKTKNKKERIETKAK